MHIKPAAGLLVRDPDLHDYLPPEGRLVPATGYWVRRLRDGDVLLVETARSKKQAALPQTPRSEVQP